MIFAILLRAEKESENCLQKCIRYECFLIVVQDPPEGFFSFENVKNDVMLEMKSKCRIISDL